MAIASNNTLTWSDIQALYTSLNTAYSKFGYTELTIPGNPGIVKTSNSLKTLNDYVNAMASYTRASGQKPLETIAVTGITIPDAGTLIYPTEFAKIQTTINNINTNGCTFDNSFFSNNCNGYNANNCNGYDSDDCNGYYADNCNGYNANNTYYSNNCNGYFSNNCNYGNHFFHSCNAFYSNNCNVYFNGR